jgi:hypothetical protein
MPISEEAFDPVASAGLFVGVSSFEDERIAAVPFAVDDAVDLAHLLTLELGLILPERTVLLLAGEPQKPESIERLTELLGRGAHRRSARMPDVYRYLVEATRNTEGRGLFVLTMATHGVSDQGGDFLLATDSLRERTIRTGIVAAELFDEVSRSGAQRRLVLLDACRERLSQGTRGEVGAAMAPSFANAIARARGSVVLSASTLGGFAYDDPVRGNGVFTAAVIDGLRGEAKASPEGWITVRTLADFVQPRVAEWVRRNRPDHIARSLGIARHIEATAENLPLARHPEAPLASVEEIQGSLPTREHDPSASSNLEAPTGDVKKTGKKGKMAVFLAMLLLLAAAGLFIVHLWPSARWESNRDSSLERVSPSLGESDAAEQGLRELRTLRDFEARRTIGVRLLTAVTHSLPDSLWLVRLNLSPKGTISIAGDSDDESASSAFGTKLSSSSGFTEFSLRDQPPERDKIYSFVLESEPETLPSRQQMTVTLQQERNRMLHHLSSAKDADSTLRQICAILEEEVKVPSSACEPEKRWQKADDRIEVVLLSAKFEATSTLQLARLFNQLAALPRPVALRMLELLPAAGQKISADLTLEIPVLQESTQILPVAPEPPRPLEMLSDFSREPFRRVRPKGIPGLEIGDLSLVSIDKAGHGFVARVTNRGIQKGTYSLREGDKLYDGDLLSISSQEVVFRQHIYDPTGKTRYREVKLR